MTIKDEMKAKLEEEKEKKGEVVTKLKKVKHMVKKTTEQKKIEKLTNEVAEQKKCIKDKDKRISKIENKFKFIHDICLFAWYSFLVIGSFALWLESWVLIASNGKWNIFDFLNNFFVKAEGIEIFGNKYFVAKTHLGDAMFRRDKSITDSVPVIFIF